MRIGVIGLGNKGGPMALSVFEGRPHSNTLFCLQEERAGVPLRTGGR
jgi:3-hydroxyisobutyrate dehydrogenase-like beta-hydroxyacid dehydrogenase